MTIDLPIRELTTDELKGVAGGDSHVGEGICSAPHLIFKIADVTVLVGIDWCDYL